MFFNHLQLPLNTQTHEGLSKKEAWIEPKQNQPPKLELVKKNTSICCNKQTQHTYFFVAEGYFYHVRLLAVKEKT